MGWHVQANVFFIQATYSNKYALWSNQGAPT